MLNHIIRFSVRNKLIIGILMLGLIGWGIFSFSKLPIDAVPDITNNQVLVITVSPSLAAPEVERLITFPIEQSTASIPGIEEIRSFSRFGLSLVTIVFNDRTDVYWARQQVSERLQQVRTEIPADAGNPFLGPVTTGLGEIFQYVIKPKKGYESSYTPTELRTIQDWIVRRQLLGTPGVADVSSFGGNLKQYEVSVNSDRLKSMNVTMEELFSALQHNNQNTGGAYIEKGPTALYIRSEGLVRTLDDIGRIYIKQTANGIPVYIKDVAEVKIGSAVKYGAMCYNDKGEVAGAVVMMLKGSNSSEVIRNVKEKIKSIEKTLPEGVEITPFLDRTKMVDNAIGTVKKNLIEGALIVIFILVVFLGNFRAGLIVASVIPLSMMFAVILMNALGVSGNLMSLGALDFGLIVDGAVIIVEAVMHRLYHSRQFNLSNSITQETMNDEVEKSAGKMMNSAVFGQIVILIVYLPILALVGIEGKMFKPMAQTVSFALIGAFILSLTYVPMVTSLFLSKKMNHRVNISDKLMRLIQRMYEPALRKALAYPKIITVSVIILFIFSFILLLRMGGEFIPKLEEGDFAVDTRLLTGSSLSQTIESTQQSAGILLKRFPEVEKVVTKIGSGEIPTDPMPIEASDMMVILKDKKEWTSAKSFDELADKMSKALEDVPGIMVGFQYPVQMRFNELMTGARQDVVCKIFGEDLDTLSAYSQKLGDVVGTVEGATDLYVEKVTGLPQIVIKYNNIQMSHYQLNVSEVNKVIRTAFAGESAGLIYENERRFELVVRLSQQSRKDLSDVQNLLIATPSGLQIPLYQVATVEIKEGTNQIQREDAKRRIVVGFNVRGRDVQSVVDELSLKINNQLKLPSGYFVTYGGQFENLVEAKKRLSTALPIALSLIMIMLYFAFGKLKYGLLIFSAIPLSAIGGIMALWLRGMPFSISAGVGFIALFGVAVLNGIVLITEFNRLKEQGMHDLEFIIREGTKNRLRPVLMTASVASLGFLPMALSTGAGAEVQRPLATVVIGGLITATFLTLVLLPILYMWLERKNISKKTNRVISILLISFFLSSTGNSQTTTGKLMNLDDMLNLADAQNFSIQALHRETAYWKQLQNAVADQGKTLLGAEYGKINSMNNDSRFSISQSFTLPIIYNRQKQFYNAAENSQKALTLWKLQELHREIKFSYWTMADLLNRQALLQKLDSVYNKVLEAAELRFKTGESNLLEKINAKAQLAQLKIQESQIQSDFKITQQKLQWLLNTTEQIQPDIRSISTKAPEWVDTIDLMAHPLLKYRKEQVELTKAQTSLDRNKMVPDLSAGYSNMTIVGYQTPDGISQKYYGPGKRFGSVNVSVGVPLFTKATRNKVKAGKYAEEATELNLKAADLQLRSQLMQYKEEFHKQQKIVQYYDTEGLDQAELIIRHALQNFEKGQISYLEWTMMMQNASAIQLSRLDAIHKLNMVRVDIEYIISNL